MQEINISLEELELSKIINYEANNKIHLEPQVDELIANFKTVGIVDPIFVDEDNIILQGHKRLLALQKFGKNKTKVIRVTGLNKKGKSIYRIASNKLTHNSQWDFTNLKAELEDYDQGELETLGLDFDFSELETVGEIEEDEIPEVQTKAISEPGDLWILGEHRIICGDSGDPLLVDKLLNKKAIKLMVTDPPYGVEYDASWREDVNKGATFAKGKVLNDDIIDWSTTITLWDCDVVYMWHAGKYAVECVINLLPAYDIVSQIIWVKQHFTLSRGDYHRQHEPCWYLAKKGCKHNWQGARDQATTWEIANLNPIGKNKDEDERTEHSTQKPIECMARPIKNNSKKGDIVAEPFLGSGTTLIAAEKLGRKCYAMELNPQYVDVAIRRWQKISGLEAIREYDGKKFNSLEGL